VSLCWFAGRRYNQTHKHGLVCSYLSDIKEKVKRKKERKRKMSNSVDARDMSNVCTRRTRERERLFLEFMPVFIYFYNNSSNCCFAIGCTCDMKYIHTPLSNHFGMVFFFSIILHYFLLFFIHLFFFLVITK
jgi:hypothetical protein